MLKITIKTEDSGVHFKLEGELAGCWVRDLELSWRLEARAASILSLPVHVELADCSHVDDAGRYLLALLHLNGVHIVASGVETTELIATLTRDWSPAAFVDEKETPCA